MVISSKPTQEQWPDNLVPELGAVSPATVRHEIGKGALLAALLQDFNLVPTWCRPGAGRGIQLVALNRVGNFKGGRMHWQADHEIAVVRVEFKFKRMRTVSGHGLQNFRNPG